MFKINDTKIWMTLLSLFKIQWDTLVCKLSFNVRLWLTDFFFLLTTKCSLIKPSIIIIQYLFGMILNKGKETVLYIWLLIYLLVNCWLYSSLLSSEWSKMIIILSEPSVFLYTLLGKATLSVVWKEIFTSITRNDLY